MNENPVSSNLSDEQNSLNQPQSTSAPAPVAPPTTSVLPPTTLAELSSILRGEHELLAASFEQLEDLEIEIPTSYEAVDGEQSLKEAVGLSDLSGMLALRIAGPVAQTFVEMACAGAKIEVGESAFEPVLAGDASLVSIALLSRIREQEYLLWDVSARARLLDSWLQFLAATEQDGIAPFEDLQLEDISFQSLPLLLSGPRIHEVLDDYVSEPLPEPGFIKQQNLDKIKTLVAALPAPFKQSYLVMVPPESARVLWRSFLSFIFVNPVGREALLDEAQMHAYWFVWLRSHDRIERDAAALRAWGLVRREADFVGARALK